jgi:hypothetical protein
MGLHPFDNSSQKINYYKPPEGQKAGDTFGATVGFHLYKGVANVGPTWTLLTFKGPTAGVGYQRDDLHQIAITFSPTPKPKAVQVGEKPTLEKTKKKLELMSLKLGTSHATNAEAQFKEEMAAWQKKKDAAEAASAAAHSAAADSARAANQNLVTYQAIQNLSQALTRP